MECVTGEFGRYDRMVYIEFPDFMLEENGGYYHTKKGCSIDPCMVEEVKYLWSQGVHTTGSCCGHGIKPGMINVLSEEDEKKMIALGYEYYENKLNPRTFVAKTKHKED